tara:strand:- start:201 stop:1259 length:1059 start_codon:yes stop_codon:yes gene_type:complete
MSTPEFWKELEAGHRRPFVIAEVAQAHDGSLGIAHSFIDAVAETGADAIKFQTHFAAEESTAREPWRVPFSYEDPTRYGYWKRMEFTPEQWKGLADHCADKGLVFLSSPFSFAAVDLLDSLGMPAFKVASGEIENYPLLDRISACNRPVLLSSGLSDWKIFDAAVERVRSRGASVATFQCTTAYPTQPEQVGLNILGEMKDRYGCPVGLSDHSGTIYPSLAAATLGASLLEVHVTFDRQMFGPDGPASITLPELATMVEGVDAIYRMRTNPADKDRPLVDLPTLSRTFGKSVVARKELAAGTVLEESHLALKKPGDGCPPADYYRMIGHKTTRAFEADEALSWEGLSQNESQ